MKLWFIFKRAAAVAISLNFLCHHLDILLLIFRPQLPGRVSILSKGAFITSLMPADGPQVLGIQKNRADRLRPTRLSCFKIFNFSAIIFRVDLPHPTVPHSLPETEKWRYQNSKTTES